MRHRKVHEHMHERTHADACTCTCTQTRPHAHPHGPMHTRVHATAECGAARRGAAWHGSAVWRSPNGTARHIQEKVDVDVALQDKLQLRAARRRIGHTMPTAMYPIAKLRPMARTWRRRDPHSTILWATPCTMPCHARPPMPHATCRNPYGVCWTPRARV